MIDFIRTSASRPLFLRLSTDSWRKRLKFSGELRWLLHEDVLEAGPSAECVEFAKAEGYEIEVDNPAVGQASSLTKLLHRTHSKYVLNVEDDWHLLEEIDLDALVQLMDDHPEVNQIAFFKRPIQAHRRTFIKKEIVRNGITLTTNPHWAFTAALWRMSFIMPKWVCFPGSIHHKMNEKIRLLYGGSLEELPPADWVIKNTGTFFLGGVGGGFYTQHLGMERSLREKSFTMRNFPPYPYDHPNLIRLQEHI